MVEKRVEIIDGYTIKYHADGETRWSKGRVQDGAPEGYWEWYRIDGTLKRSGFFASGEPVGIWTTYDQQGQPYKTPTAAARTSPDEGAGNAPHGGGRAPGEAQSVAQYSW